MMFLKKAGSVAAITFIVSSMFTGTAFAVQDMNASAEFLRNAGIVQGDDGTGALRLNDQINRAELMKIVVAAATDGASDSAFHDCFPDVKKEWFARYICWASANKYIGGYPDGTFAAAKPVNTAEALKIISEVFHLDFASMKDQADAKVWFDVYLKNAIRQGIVDANLPGEVLGRPATRGEVFDYLFRAMMIKDLRTEQFRSEDYGEIRQRLMENRMGAREARALTPTEEAFIKVLRAQVAHGTRDMSASGGVKFQLELPLYKHALNLDVDMQKQAEFDGDNWAAELQFTIDAKGYSSANVSGKIVADTSLMANKDTLFLRVNSFTLSNLSADDPNAVMAFQATEQELKGNVGTWFSISRSVAEAEVTPFIVLNIVKPLALRAVDVVESSFKTKAAPFVQVTNPDANDTSVFDVKIYPEQSPEFLERVMQIMDPAANRFALRGELSPADGALMTLTDNLGLSMTYDKEDSLLRALSGGTSTTFKGTDGRDFTVKVDFSDEFAYGDVTLTFPTDAVALKFLPFVMQYRE